MIRKDERQNIAPNIYIDDIVDAAFEKSQQNDTQVSAEKLADDIEEFNTNATSLVEGTALNPYDLVTPEYIKCHVHVALQKKSEEDLVKRDTEFEGIEQYLYLDVNVMGPGRTKLKPKMLEMSGLSEDEVFSFAMENLHREVSAQPLVSVVQSLLGEEFASEDPTVPPLMLVSNRSRHHGASAVLDKEFISSLGEKIGCDEFVVIPSSIDECILIPKGAGDEFDMDFLSQMVMEVNMTTVEPEYRLTNRAYTIRINGKEESAA